MSQHREAKVKKYYDRWRQTSFVSDWLASNPEPDSA